MIHPYGVLFFLAFVAYIYSVHRSKQHETDMKETNTAKIWFYYTHLVKNKHVLSSRNIYKYQYPPKSLQYIERNITVKSVFEKLYPIRVFDEHLIGEIIILVEHFLRTHYKVVIGKYDPQLFIQHLEDIAEEVDVLFQRFVYNIPNVSSLFDIEDLDMYVHEQHKIMMNLLQRHIRIVRNKYHLSTNRVV